MTNFFSQFISNPQSPAATILFVLLAVVLSIVYVKVERKIKQNRKKK
ncbi:MAG: hypothetical protein IKV41_02630 [Oscillospiraceae bacterium]|nr:hypothetical protein [Oscillospiraceae bacterium]